MNMARILLPRLCVPERELLTSREASGGFHNDKINFQERRPMMDIVFVLAIIGFFALCVGYAYAFDRI